MLSKPLFGALADHFKIQKLLFLFFQLLSALALFTIQYVPEVPTKTPVQFHCYQESSLVACDSIEPDAVGEVLKESMANGSTLCDVQCEINRNSSFYSDLCHGWRLSQYCPTSNSSTVFSGFPSDIPGPSILEMTVEIPLKHYLKEGNCSYFRVHNAIFSDKSPVVPYCEEFQTSECSALCDNAAVMDLITKPIDDNYSPAESHQFWIFVLLLVVAWSSMAVVTSVGDAICFGMLGERPTHYGRQRLWGAVGWGLFTLITGLLLDELSKNQVKKNYSIAFYIVVVNILLSIIVSYKLQYNQTRISSNIFVNMWSLVSQPRILVFIAWCIVVGMNTAILWQFLFWHLEDLAGSDRKWIKALEGLASAVQCVGGELPLFFLSGWIIKRLGHIHVMTLVLLSFGIRFLLYSVLSNPWLCLPIELFQGVTFGLCYATMTSYASILAAPGTETTVQGLVGAVFEGVGAGLGSLIGGYLTFVSSGSTMFGIFGGISIVLAILHAVAQYFLSRTPIAPAAGKAFQTVKYSAPSDDNEGCEEEEVLS